MQAFALSDFAKLRRVEKGDLFYKKLGNTILEKILQKNTRYL